MGANLNRVRLREQRQRGDLESRDRRDQDDALWHRFYDSMHKAQRDHNHPTETLKFIALALASLGEVLQEAMR